MADFGGFEIEDDEKRPSSPSAFGGFEIEDGDEGEPGETGSAASAEASTPKSPAPTSVSPALAPEPEAPPAHTWESGDGGEPTLPVGEKNQWGGNLRTEGRKPLIRRDANGKVSGYSTTTSMGLTLPDGRIAVVPTVVDGKELSQEDAARHYADTGEYWGMADDEEGAKKIARAVHDENQKAYQKGWNEYIHEHWDEMGDGIRNDRGVAYEHKKRTAPDSITGLERYANSDFDLPDGDVEKSRAVIQDFAKEAGLEPWQAERLLQSADKPYRLRSYMPWIAQQRMREIPRERERKQKELDARMQAIQDEKGKETGHLENVRNVFSNIGLGSLAGVHKAIGTALGGEVDVRNDRVEEVMVDHPLAKKDGETFDSWYERVQESFNPKKRMEGESKAEYGLRRNASARIKREAKKYFDWMAPVAGKEGMHKEQRVLRGVNPRLENGGTSIGNFFLDLGGHIQETLDEDYAVGKTGNVAVDWVSNAATGIGKFGMLNIAAIPVFANEAYLQTKTTALKSGKSVAEAESLGSTAGLVDGALTAAFYAAPFKRWFNSKGITPVQRVASGSFSDMSRGMGRYFAKREMLNVGVAALEAGGIMGVQGAADTAIAQLAQGQDVDLGEVTVGGLKGVRDGVLIGAVMGGARILNARIKGAKEYERIVREAIKTPEGRQALAEMNVEGMADFLEAFEKGGVADSAQADRAGLPKMSIQERGQFASRMKAQGVTSEMLRRGAADFRRRAAESFRQDPSNQLGARSGDGDIGDGHGDLSPKPPSPDAPPPSTDLASRIKSEFGTEPVGFNIPQTPDGKPKLTPMKWRENRTGKENTCNIAHDPNTGVTIMEESDGSFSVYNDTGDSDGAASLDEAIEKANELALMGQYTPLDRKRKKQVIENERETKYGKKNVAYFNTMADAADAFENGIGREGSMFGLSDASQLRDPAVQDRDAFYTPDGTTVVILDNVQEVNDIPRILAHEIVGHGGPNGEFGGRTGAQVVFAENIRAKEFEAFKKEIVDGLRKEVRASDMDAVNRNLGEVFAHYAAANLDQEPSKLDKLVSAVNGAARKLKLRKTYSAADVRTMMARWRNAVKGEGGELFDLTDGSPRFEFFPAEETKPTEVKDETGTGADETQPQPESGAAEPAGAEAPRAEEGAPPRAEAPDAGVVEPSENDNGGQNLNSAESPAPADTIGGDAEQQPMSESSFWNVMHRKGERRRVPVDSIKIPDTQFKENADPKTGVVKGQELGEYYENAENPIAIYERKDGTMEIVTGRHRLDAAKRSGWKDIDARIFRESDGYTPEDMRLYDAVANILDEKGTVKDYVRFFDESGFSEEDAKSSGILNRQKGRMAFGIVQNATDDTRGAIDWEGTGGDGLISAEQAAIIADAAPKQAALQRILVRRALDGVRGKKLAILARSLAEEAKRRKNAPKADSGTQLDLFTSEEDVALLQQEEKRADYRAKKANEYKRIAENLRTAMRKGGRLDLNKDYAKELGISDPKDKAQLAAARDKAVERANYWENAIRLDDADKAQMDADLGIAPKLQLESVTAEQETAEQKKRAEKEAIKKRQEAPLNGSGAVNVQPEMDLGQTGQQDLFSPIAEKPAQKPAKTAPASAPRAEGTTTPPKIANTPQGGETAENATQRKYAELLSKLDEATKRLDAAVEAEKKSGGAIADQIASREAIIDQYRAELAVRRFEREHKNERLGQNWSDVKDRPYTSLTDNGIRERIANATTSIAQLKEELPNSAPAVWPKGWEHGKSLDGYIRATKADITALKPGDEVAVAHTSGGAFGAKQAIFATVRSVGEEYDGAANADIFIGDYKDGVGYDQDARFKKSEIIGIRRKEGKSETPAKPAAPKSSAPTTARTTAKPAFKRGDRVFIKGAKDGQRVTFLKANADGTADVQVRTPGANRYAPEKVETRTVPMGDISATGMKDTLTDAERKRLAEGMREQSAQTIVMPDADAAKEVRDALDAIDFDTPELGTREKQGALSGATSRPQVPAADTYGKKWKIFKPGTRNADIGAGKYELATEFLADIGVENIKFDPVNRDSETNRRAAEDIRANPADTATVNNVLNVIDNDAVMDGIINQAARAIKKNGTALFTIHPGSANKEGAKPGDRIGRQTKGGSYQRYWPAADYVPHIKKYFDHVETHGNVILAKQPKDVGPAFWAFDSTFDVGVSFDTPEFDPDKFGRLVTGVGNLVDKLTKYGYKDFKSLATYIYEQDTAKYGRAKPVLQDIWNAVARARGLARVSDAQADKVYAAIEKPQETAPARETPKAPPANKLKETRISDAADEIVALIERGQKFTRKDVTDIVERQLGGKVSNGDFDAKQVTDILELAVNRFVANGKSLYSPAANASADAAVRVIERIRENILALIPTQTTRSIEQDKMQQFSTPPHEAFAAAWVANMNDGDVMLEPSAGIGGIAVFGASAGAKVITNELSPLRSEILEQLGLGKPFEFNAENLYAFLEPDIKAGKLKRPTVVVMNPPFSNSQRTDKKNTHIGADHVEQALKLLAPGGRLVAIVGNGMAHDRPAFKAWWDRIGREYTVRANVGVNGQEYAKYGTTFDNNIIVIDKVAPNGSITPIYGKIESLDELPALLEGVRNDRPQIKNQKLDTRVDERIQQQAGGTEPVHSGGPLLPTGNDGDGSAQPDGRRVSGGNGRGTGSGRPEGRGVADGRQAGESGERGLDKPLLEEGLAVQSVDQAREIADGTFSEYRPSKVRIPGMKPHPTALVESSAMASVQPPNPTYSPKIPKKIIEDGVLSEAQIEQVIYAGQAHEQMLGNGERKGYFIGDGTGVGKGREISGIILDNFNNGRRKAVWVSKTGDLSRDAKRDLEKLGLGGELFTLESKNLNSFTSRQHGVAFTTYSSLASEHEGIDANGVIRADPKAKGGSRMQLLAKWLGKDFDGVIVFDESHKAGNAISVKGKRGNTDPSDAALAVIDLQKILPNARIVYVSATGATEVRNLAYATRLGLWGRGTAFKDRDAFITQVSNGGISVMEIVARDMKAMGVYMARTLSYEGIENERVTHELSPDQVKQYNLLAETWQMVMGEIESALISSNGIHGKANGNAKSAFWGAHQRFFNQTLTAMQMPSVLAKAREMWDAGYSPVFQLVSTNEATQKKALDKARKEGSFDVENLDLSPREILIGFVEQSFPTALYVEEQTDGGKTRWVPQPDGHGGYVKDPAAVERKERLLGRLRRMKIGESPLDMILNEFGHENVAEITGRKSRREMVRNEDGEMEARMVKRTKNNSKHEADDFNDGKRTVLVFSGAGNTGFSFHADRNFKNQRRRAHFLIEAGYNAADAIQGLGRTHRSNESSHPLYMLCSTNLPGHKRFMSTIARRLAQLGSLTAGDRSSSGSGVFSESDNLENQYAKNAVVDIFEEMFQSDSAKFDRICTEMGFMKARVNSETGEREYVNTLINEDGEFDPKEELAVPHFLNRILAMKIDAQNELFDEFSKRMADDIERAKENGTFDPGMEKLKGITVEVKNRTRLWEDAQKIGTTDIVEVGVTKKSRKTDYATAKERMSLAVADGAVPRVYTHNGSGDVLMMVETKQAKTMKDGSIVSLFRRLKPNGEVDYTTETAVEKNYTQVLRDEEGVWTRAYEATPDLIEQSRFFANGTLLPIWDRLGATNPRFFKVAPTGGAEMQTFLGMEIAPENVENVLARFGKSVGAVEVTPDVQLRRVMKDGKRVELQNGWTLKRVKVLGDSRIEIDGVDEDADVMRLAREPFAYSEKIGYLRVFLKPNAESMAQFLAEYPAVPDKGGLATASGTAQDLSGDKYKAPLRAYWSRIERATPADATVLGNELRNFIVRLSSEQLGEVFDDYRALDNDELSAAHVIRKLALNELEARGALDWKRRQQAESESRGGNIVNFDTPELTPAEAEYAAGEDKTPTEKVMREVYGMTNDEIATALRASGMEPPAHVKKSDEAKWRQAEVILSNPTYMAKLSRAAAKFPRPLRDFEIDALNVLFRERQNAVNAAQGEVDDLKQTLGSIADGEVGAATKKEDARKNLAAAQSGLARAKALMLETGKAKIGGASEQGRGLRANRGSLYQDDLTYAGITGEIAQIVGGADRITPEMDAQIRDLAKLFGDLDAAGRRIATERAKPIVEKIIAQTKNGLKVRKATERRFGDEAKRVARNYENALIQIEVGAAETGGTLIGMTDKMHDGWRKWLNALGEFHCFENPDITEEEVVNAILDDISPFMDGVDADQVRDVISNLGHNYKMSRYDSQRLMNSLRNISRYKRQIDWMDETNTMPPATGPIRDEPTQDEREWAKKVRERKAEVPDAGRDERRLKGVLDSAKTRVRNRIADLQRAIETGERIPASQRKVVEDLELRELKRQKEERQKAYDELFKTERTMTDAQRIALAEKLLAKELERALEDLDRARAGDFSKRPKRPGVESSTIDVLRDRIAQTREQIRELKKAKYEFGMTPEEVAALNARKMASREKALARLAERVATGDTRTQKKPQPPMPPDMKKRYDELGEQMNRAHRKLADIRREAADARKPAFVRFVGSAYRFIDSMWKMATASLDFTQVGNQTGSILAAHPKLVAENFAKTLKAFSSQVHADSIDADLLSDPAVREAVDNKWLHWKKVSELSNSGERVEMFDAIDKPFTLFGKAIRFTDIPIYGKLIANSDRLYATYINAVSASLYSSIVNDPNLFPGGASAFQKKMLCDMINVMNGSGTISKGTRRVLGRVLWAPGLVDSQLKRMVGYQIWHPWLAESEEDGSGSFKERAKMSWIGAKEWARSNIGALLLGGLLFALFATDDQKDEFKRAGLLRKFQMTVAPRIRHTQLDFTGGAIAFLRLADRLVRGEYETSSGKTAKVRDPFGELSHFAKGRVTPLISNAFSLLSGRDYTGADFGMTELLLSLAPISISAAAKSIQENGIRDRAWTTAIVASTLTMFGIGKGTYRKDDYKILTNRFLEDKKEYESVMDDADFEEADKEALLSDMRSKNRLMEDEARLEIGARIDVVKKFASAIRKLEKAGRPVPQDMVDGMEEAKSDVIELIRKYRRD